MKTLILLTLLFLGGDLMPRILYLTGATSEEELSEEVVERFEHLADHPLDINTASRRKLLSTGLFSAFQAASLLEYREETGPVRSMLELSLIDGFSADLAHALEPFVLLASDAPPGAQKPRNFSQTLRARGGVRLEEGELPSWSGKAVWQGQWKDRATLTLSSAPTFAASFRAGPLSLFAGDYNTRFGQGLLLWSGFALSGVPSGSAISRNPAGITTSASYSPAMRRRGAAFELELKGLTLSGFWSVPGLFGGNAAFYGRRLSASLTALANAGVPMVSADFKYSPGGVALFGEAAWDFGSGVGAALLGADWVPAYGARVGIAARYYPDGYHCETASPLRSGTKARDEAGVSLAGSWSWAELTLDAARHPSAGTTHLRTILKLSPRFGQEGRCLDLSFRGSVRWRPEESWPWRIDLRTDLAGTLGPWHAGLRANVLHSRGWGFLVYAEAGWKTDRAGAWLRLTAFDVQYWEDRIYAYQRDAPGEFSVPACYGRGLSASLYAYWKPFYLTVAPVLYECGVKASRLDVKLSVVWRGR